MSEEIIKKLNATDTIYKFLPAIIEAFTTFYGEEERDNIISKFKNMVAIGYCSPKNMESIISNGNKQKSDELIEEFLNSLNLNKEEKDKIRDLLFDSHELEYGNLHPISNYISYLNGNKRTYIIEYLISYLKYFYPDVNINKDNLEELISSKRFKTLDDLIPKYQELMEKYRAYKEEIKPYQEYVESCDRLKRELEKKYTKKLVSLLKDLFTEEEYQQIETAFENPYYVTIKNVNAKTKNYLETYLSSNTLIESFSQENEKLLLDGSDWQKRSIKRDRVNYFKNFGIDLGDNYEDYLQNEQALSLIPSKELVSRIIETKEAMYTEMINEYYQSTLEYQKNRARIDELDLIDKKDGYDAKAYERQGTCVNTNVRKTESGFISHPILCLYVSNYNDYLDASLIHELNHVYESTLKEINEYRYLITCGWEFLDSEISSKREQVVSLEERREKRNYELFNEIINEMISQEICQILHDSGSYIFNTPDKAKIKGSTSYEHTMFLVKEFYNLYKKEIIESRKNGDMTPLFNAVGKENFDALNELFHIFHQNIKGAEIYRVYNSIKNGEETEKTKIIKELIEKRNKILQNMQEHYQKNPVTL